MNTLLFLVTLVNNQCIIYLSDNADYTNSFSGYQITAIDVYKSDNNMDDLVSKVFTKNYQVSINNQDTIAYCLQ